MKPETWERIEKLFKEVRELAPEDRRRLLEGAEPEVRAEVESLLEHSTAGNFLARLPAPVPLMLGAGLDDDDADRLIGTKLGGVTITRLIACGGMSYVYEALQDKPTRTVAVKVIKPDTLSQNALHRFEQESNILARIPHSAISQVFTYGVVELETQRLPYIVMELVRGGEWITKYAEKHTLSRDQRLSLFIEVCKAIEFAHQNGVIHRDLKPSNILVDEHGNAKVIDFGVARIEDCPDARMTLSGQLVGTLSYMSPEQINGSVDQVDTRTDVFALGLILYELLMNQLPYDVHDQSIASAARIICTVEPEFPHKRLLRMGNDLEAVILRSLGKEREERYQSVREFRQDIERVLKGEPVEARSPTVWVRSTRWIGHHPLITTTGLCSAVVAMSVLLAVVVVYFINGIPTRIVLDQQGFSARLVSRSGNNLFEWRSQYPGGLINGQLVERHQKYGGGQVAVLIFEHDAVTDDSEDGELCLFSVDKPYELLWSTSEVPPIDPPHQLHRAEASWSAVAGGVADFLPEVPGEELLVIHQLRPYSASWIRIFDMGGNLHYQVAHDGAIRQIVWFKHERVLLLCGSESEAVIGDRGVDAAYPRYPPAVFGLQPRASHIALDRWIVRSGQVNDPTVLWFKMLGPPEAVASAYRMGPWRWPMMSIIKRGRKADITWNFEMPNSSDTPGLSWNISADGKVSYSHSGDDYKILSDLGKVPSEEIWRWVDYEDYPQPVPGAHPYDPPSR